MFLPFFLAVPLWPADPDAELARFPPAVVAVQACELCCAYERHLLRQRDLGIEDKEPLYRAWLANETECWPAWNTLRSSHLTDTVAGRRSALRRLREILGDVAYFRGEMPPPVPVWLFKERK